MRKRKFFFLKFDLCQIWLAALCVLAALPAQAEWLRYQQNISANALNAGNETDTFDTGNVIETLVSHSATVVSDGTASNGGFATITASGSASFGSLGISATGMSSQEADSQVTSLYITDSSAGFNDILTMGAGTFDFVFKLSSTVTGSPVESGGTPNIGVSCQTEAKGRFVINRLTTGTSTLEFFHNYCDGGAAWRNDTDMITMSFDEGETVEITGLLGVDMAGRAGSGISATSMVDAGNTAIFLVVPNASTPDATYTTLSGFNYLPTPPSDVPAVGDVSGDGVPDLAHLAPDGQPKVRYYSGASRQKIKGVSYFGGAWTGIAAATVADGNADGNADDPAVAVLAHKANAGKNAVEVRRADNGAVLNKIDFLSASWQVIDVAVIDDKNGDGVIGDAAIAVLGYNPTKAFDQQIKVQVRKLSNGKLLASGFYLNGNWRPLALEAVNRVGQTPLLSVLATKPTTGANIVQARKFSNGSVQRDTSFFNADWRARDVSILNDSNGDGNPNDPAYLVLAIDRETGRNKVQARRVNDGARLQNITMLGTNWNGQRVAGAGDISGNLREEVGVLAVKKTDGTVAIQLKDFEDRSTTAIIFP